MSTECVEQKIRQLHREGALSTEAAGELLVALGATRRRAHPDEAANDVYEQEAWRDDQGQVWPMPMRDPIHWRAESGTAWHWAGGYGYIPDKQPLLSRDDRSEQDVPLCYVELLHGTLNEA